MSFDQLSFDDKTGVNADSFSAQSALQHMSRRCIMALSANALRVIGLASSNLFCTASACTSVLTDAATVDRGALVPPTRVSARPPTSSTPPLTPTLAIVVPPLSQNPYR
jgi:hypothetical protein